MPHADSLILTLVGGFVLAFVFGINAARGGIVDDAALPPVSHRIRRCRTHPASPDGRPSSPPTAWPAASG